MAGDYNLDVTRLDAAVTPHPGGHRRPPYGRPAPVADLPLLRRPEAHLIEDYQAHGAIWRGRCGRWGIAGALSFYPGRISAGTATADGPHQRRSHLYPY